MINTLKRQQKIKINNAKILDEQKGTKTKSSNTAKPVKQQESTKPFNNN